MSCLICAGHAQSIDCPAGWEERSCPACGDYQMSHALIMMMMEEGLIFDTRRMREWLNRRRRVTLKPTVDVLEAILLS